ncbi:hypothetical protein [Chelatococcus sambhunathii]|uniref:hypothetical protein n=1 Tax=Chelatococcus sambhunathii TaxID=363953 RepID=UPI0028525732|nr:hypothetical protein [Chelatococcus sambhunathii]
MSVVSKSFGSKMLRVALALGVLGSVAGCESLSKLNPFEEKETPLPGERRPVPKVAPPPPDTVPQPLSALPSPNANIA